MIYFAQDEATCHIKIGYHGGSHLPGRLDTLQTGCPSQLVLLGYQRGTWADEQALHERFAAARVKGEWFRPVPQLIRYIIANIEDTVFFPQEV